MSSRCAKRVAAHLLGEEAAQDCELLFFFCSEVGTVLSLEDLEAVLAQRLHYLERIFHIRDGEQLADDGLSDLVLTERIEIKLVNGAAGGDNGNRVMWGHRSTWYRDRTGPG